MSKRRKANSRRPGEETRTATNQHASSDYPDAVSCASSPCPDCGVPRVGRGVYFHEPTCPLNAGVEDACDGDRDWFAARPGVSERWRPISPAEVADFHFHGVLDVQPTDVVRVIQLRPGLRSRQPMGVNLDD